jgi:hypothetical protein
MQVTPKSGQTALARLGLAAFAFLVAAQGSLPAAHAAQGNQGLQDGWAVGDQGQIAGGQLLADELVLIQQAGAGWVRVNFRLGQCFVDWTSTGCNGQSAMQTYDQVLAAVQTRNLKLLGLLSSEAWHGQQSDWSANNAENSAGANGSNAYIQAFAQNAAAVLAAHYDGVHGPLVGQWEVWNEPNAWFSNPSPGVYTGSSFMYPSNFAQLLVQTNAAIKRANPNAIVISGGVLGLDPGGTHKGARNGYKAKSGGAMCSSSVASGADYLCATYSFGWQHASWSKGAAPSDAVGQHLYIAQASTTTSNSVQKYMNDLRKAYVNFGGDPSTKQTHVTEFGWSTGSVSQAVQAQNLQTAYQVFRGTSYVARAYWYRTQDLGVAGDYYGLADPNGIPKLSLSAYQQYATF